MTIATNLGFSRMGPHRELKKALEQFWAKKSDAGELLATAASFANPTGSSSGTLASRRSRATTTRSTTTSSTRP